jgi:hypothetical protein
MYDRLKSRDSPSVSKLILIAYADCQHQTHVNVVYVHISWGKCKLRKQAKGLGENAALNMSCTLTFDILCRYAFLFFVLKHVRPYVQHIWPE